MYRASPHPTHNKSTQSRLMQVKPVEWPRDWYLSRVAQTVKRLPTMRETRVRPMGQEDPLEKEMATHSNILAWRIPWIEEPVGLQFMGLQKVGHDWVTSLSLSIETPGLLTVTWKGKSYLCRLFLKMWSSGDKVFDSSTHVRKENLENLDIIPFTLRILLGWQVEIKPDVSGFNK